MFLNLKKKAHIAVSPAGTGDDDAGDRTTGGQAGDGRRQGTVATGEVCTSALVGCA